MPRFQQVPDWSPGRLNYAPHHLVIMAECMACRDMRELDRNAVPQRWRHALIVDIEPRLKCSVCGKRDGKLRFGGWVED